MNLKNTCFLSALLTLLMLGTGEVKAFAQGELNEDEARRIDSTLHVSFITCGPGNEVWSLYGHTALRVIDRSRNLDIAVNWGMFDFNKPNFVGRFVFGLTDYMMGIYPFEAFLEDYQAEGRWVKEQRLNLTPAEKLRITEAIAESYRPENREYRYNYFYDNCTTRARDMIADHLEGNITYGGARDGGSSFRELIHRFNTRERWSRFGNDILLGVMADQKTTISEQQFLPEVMAEHLDLALVDGKRQLVDTTVVLIGTPFRNADGSFREVEKGFPLSPRLCALMLLALVMVLTFWETRKKKDLRWFDALLMLCCGLAGIVLTLMIFSQHPTVRLNLQLLLLNPLPLFFLWPMLKGRCRWQYLMWTVLICLFFIGALLQQYAEGMLFVALSLLIRNTKRLRM